MGTKLHEIKAELTAMEERKREIQEVCDLVIREAIESSAGEIVYIPIQSGGRTINTPISLKFIQAILAKL